jgi:hypothetical protein
MLVMCGASERGGPGVKARSCAVVLSMAVHVTASLRGQEN